jgi:hypothetical protein
LLNTHASQGKTFGKTSMLTTAYANKDQTNILTTTHASKCKPTF